MIPSFQQESCRCDLSISAGSKATAEGDPVTSLEPLREFILTDDSGACWRDLVENTNSTVSLVMDNSGFELFTDLCLADFLITTGVVTKIRYCNFWRDQLKLHFSLG